MNELLRISFLFYFITHIPITICIDLQGIFHQHYPVVLQELYQWYLITFNDVVMTAAHPWLQSFLYAELFLQFPFFFFVTYAFMFKKNWIRIPAICYGAHVTTTLLPIILEVIMSPVMTAAEKAALLSIYSPYLLFPLALMLYMSCYPHPFGRDTDSVDNNNDTRINKTNTVSKKMT